MSDQLQVFIALLLYLALFAWIGYQRGSLRETLVFLVAVGGYFGLLRYQGPIITLLNLFGKFIAFARSGGLTSDDPNAILKLRDAPNIVQPDDAGTVIFVIWAILLVLAYVITNLAVPRERSQPGILAILMGVANGLFYILVFLPRLIALVLPDAEISQELAQAGFRKVISTTSEIIGQNFQELWSVLEPQRSLIFLLLITGLVVLAATTLNSARARS